MNIWELSPQIDSYGKAAWQKVTVTVKQVLDAPRPGQYAAYQNVLIEGQHGTPFKGSVMFSNRSSLKEFPSDSVGKPIDCSARVEADASQYAVNGLKYTLRLDAPAAGGSGRGSYSGGGSYKRETPQEAKRRDASILLHYCIEREAAGKMEYKDFHQFIEVWDAWIDDFVNEHTPKKPGDNIPI